MYQWSNGQQDSVATGLVAGDYSVTVTDAAGCQKTTQFNVPQPIVFTAGFPADTTILTGTSATLMVDSDNPSVQVTWTPLSSGTALTGNPLVFQPAETQTFLVRAFIGDCSITDSVTVTVRDNLFEVPNAFTPNGDQMNDRFKPVLYAGTVVNLSIWSRWGQLVYAGNAANGWDGTFDGEAAPSDVYVYQLLIRLPSGEEQNRHGDVTLIR
jgi:gliding motility-associated-like protein